MKKVNGYPFSIGDAAFGSDGRCLLIAEIGTAHGGSLNKAYELISAAKEAGADCAKFQMVFADEIIHPRTGSVLLPGGNVRLFDRFKAVEKDEDFYLYLKEYAEKLGLIFLCTPFGIRSARSLRNIGVTCFKIASPELNHFELLDEVASYKLPTILSSGVSMLGDIERALARFGGNAALLHCITSYPAPEEEYNLRVLGSLQSVFGVPVGVSDHSLDPVLVPALSVAAGGCIVEKHFTLSRTDGGLDDPIALTPEDFSLMAQAVRKVEGKEREEAIDSIASEFGRERVERVLGTGIKTLAPSEKLNYERTNRSIHARRAIRAGEALSGDNIAVLRTEKILRPGLPPDWMERLEGKKAARDIPDGEGVTFDDLTS
jgi:sialic acid synthase SpsE